jgi:protoporphyrinogen oxidase
MNLHEDCEERLTILGGGPAGLGLALRAHQSDIPFVLFEKASQVGGLCRTLRCGEHLYDSGAHRFHDQDPEVTATLRDLMGDDLRPVHAPSKIYDRGGFINFPPTPLNLLRSSGLREIGRIAWELLSARWQSALRDRQEISFRDFAVSRFGETLAKRLLLDYSEKLWGLPAGQLAPDVATRRLQGMTLRTLLREFLLPKTTTTHIDGAFLYPRSGYGSIATAIQGALPTAAIRTAHEVTRLECWRGSVHRLHFAGHAPVEVSGKVVSTLPLTLLVRLLGEQIAPDAHRAAEALRFRHIRLIFLRLNQPGVSPHASIYLPDLAFCVSRVSEPKNRSVAMAPAHETGLVAEVPCFTGDPICSMPPEDLAARVIGELQQIRLIDPNRVIEWRHHFLANAYPVYGLGFTRHVRAIQDALAAIHNLETLGRGGLFLYGSLHDQLRFAKEYIDQLTATREFTIA